MTVNDGYMNELRPRLNERYNENRMTKKDLKELIVIAYTNNVHLPFRWLNHKNYR